jgi:hypothetical protein
VCRTSRPVRFFAVLLALGGGLALFVPAAGAGCRIGLPNPRQLDRCARRLRVRCSGVLFEYSTSMFALAGWRDTGNRPRRNTVRGRLIPRGTGTSEQTWSKHETGMV